MVEVERRGMDRFGQSSALFVATSTATSTAATSFAPVIIFTVSRRLHIDGGQRWQSGDQRRDLDL